jgi:hypothetical protein
MVGAWRTPPRLRGPARRREPNSTTRGRHDRQREGSGTSRPTITSPVTAPTLRVIASLLAGTFEQRSEASLAVPITARGRVSGWLAAQGRQGGGHGVQVGLDVCRGGRAGAVGVAGVGAGDAVAEVALNPCQGGVAQPVDRDALGGDPGESLADTEPEVVVAAAGQGVAVAVAQQLIGGQERTPTGGVVGQADREGGADGLPADGAALLAELDQAVVGVEVGAAQGQAAPRGTRFSVRSRSSSASRATSLPLVQAVRLICSSSWAVGARGCWAGAAVWRRGARGWRWRRCVRRRWTGCRWPRRRRSRVRRRVGRGGCCA